MDSAANVIIPSTVVRGIGQPLIMVALSVLAVSGLAKDEAGSASALFSMLRNLGCRGHGGSDADRGHARALSL